jgi:plasmid stability protein
MQAAERHSRSMEEEVRDILRNATKEENRPLPNLGSRIAARFAKAGLSEDLPELRGQAPRRRARQVSFSIRMSFQASCAKRRILGINVIDPWQRSKQKNCLDELKGSRHVFSHRQAR